MRILNPRIQLARQPRLSLSVERDHHSLVQPSFLSDRVKDFEIGAALTQPARRRVRSFLKPDKRTRTVPPRGRRQKTETPVLLVTKKATPPYNSGALAIDMKAHDDSVRGDEPKSSCIPSVEFFTGTEVEQFIGPEISKATENAISIPPLQEDSLIDQFVLTEASTTVTEIPSPVPNPPSPDRATSCVSEEEFVTPAPIPPRKQQRIVDEWERKYDDLNANIEHQDCHIPHQLLVDLQESLLKYLDAQQITPCICVQSNLSASTRNPTLNPSGTIPSMATFMSKSHSIPKVNNVLKEEGMTFFARFQKNPYQGLSATEQIRLFLDDIHCGPTGGRSVVGDAIRSVENMPVVCYGTGPYAPECKARIRIGQGDRRWSTFSACVCPIKVTVVPTMKSEEAATSLSKEEEETIQFCSEILSRMMTDWRMHSLRMFYVTSSKYRTFLPALGNLESKTLKCAGWEEMTFNGNCLIRWIALKGGLIFAYMHGSAESSLDKALGLVYDGDNHKEWIPFLSETNRLFSMNPFSFAFRYSINLPWPMNKRQLTILGMATDALKCPDLNAVQIWGSNAPEKATTLFGIPIQEPEPNVVQMEMPSMGFSLSSKGKDETFVRLCAVFDVKINFLPVAVQKYMARHMATKMFGNVQRICKNFDQSIYKDVIEKNRPFLDRLLEINAD